MTQVSDLFSYIKDSLVALDPVAYCEKYLTLDGQPFRLNGNGYKPFADVYRYIGSIALDREKSKPVVIVKGRQVGATTMAAALELYLMTCGLYGKEGKPPIRIMHCFPQLELAYAYTKTKLNSMIVTAIDDPTINKRNTKRKSIIETKLDAASPSNDSLQYKQFTGGNHIWIESMGLKGDRIRGRTIDVMFVDECQDCRGEAISNSIKVLAKAQYGKIGDGVQVYFGTPKQHGTEYWRMWNYSSQQYYHLGCEKCKEHFPLYTPGSDEWENIWIEDELPEDDPSHGYIVKCTHCGHEQDKRDAAERGQWVSYNKNEEDPKYIGYHINQLYMPEFKRSKIIGEKPENHPINTERAYRNEVLGEFFKGDASPITQEEIDRMCADPERRFRKYVGSHEGKQILLGADWGDKIDPDMLAKGDIRRQRGQSFSCVVALEVEGPNLFSVIYAHRLKQNDLEYKKGFIEQMFRQYSLTLACADIGFANDLTEILQREHGTKFLGTQAVGRLNGHYKFKDDIFPATIMFEKDYLYSYVFDLLKRGNIRFPYKDYEQVSWLVQHCSSMELKPTVDRSGEVNVKYVKGTMPNDGFAALCNAVLAQLYLASEGFSITHPNQMKNDPKKKEPIPAIVGYIPGMNSTRRRSFG